MSSGSVCLPSSPRGEGGRWTWRIALWFRRLRRIARGSNRTRLQIATIVVFHSCVSQLQVSQPSWSSSWSSSWSPRGPPRGPRGPRGPPQENFAVDALPPAFLATTQENGHRQTSQRRLHPRRRRQRLALLGWAVLLCAAFAYFRWCRCRALLRARGRVRAHLRERGRADHDWRVRRTRSASSCTVRRPHTLHARRPRACAQQRASPPAAADTRLLVLLAVLCPRGGAIAAASLVTSRGRRPRCSGTRCSSRTRRWSASCGTPCPSSRSRSARSPRRGRATSRSAISNPLLYAAVWLVIPTNTPRLGFPGMLKAAVGEGTGKYQKLERRRRSRRRMRTASSSQRPRASARRWRRRGGGGGRRRRRRPRRRNSRDAKAWRSSTASTLFAAPRRRRRRRAARRGGRRRPRRPPA